MKRIIKIGMDVHTTNYTLCVFEPSFEHEGTVHYITQVKPEVKNIIDVIRNSKKSSRMMNSISSAAMKQDALVIPYIMILMIRALSVSSWLLPP